MALSLQTNLTSLTGQKNVARSERALATSMNRLSSGLRINSASDDAAGLAISEKLRAQARSLGQAQRNANDGVSLLQTAEGALNEVSDMLVRMRELAVQAANGTLGYTERQALDSEFSQLRSEIDRIADVTEFAGIKLLNGAQTSGLTLQVGVKNTAQERIVVSLSDTHVSSLNSCLSALTITSANGAWAAMSSVDLAINAVNSRRGTLGAKQNRLFTTINTLAAQFENISAANSRIRDTDVASETANLARTQILMQAGISVLAQANQFPGMSLTLMGR